MKTKKIYFQWRDTGKKDYIEIEEKEQLIDKLRASHNKDCVNNSPQKFDDTDMVSSISRTLKSSPKASSVDTHTKNTEGSEDK